MTDVDAVRLNFSASTLHLLNAILGIVMFGVALDMKGDDVRRVVTNPRPVLIGLLGHYLVFPAVTFLLVTILRPAPSIALGMMLVASCPAGNISNFLVHLAGGNTALSVSISSASTVLSVVLTPLVLRAWGTMYAPTRTLLRDVAVDPVEMFVTIFLLLGLPLAAGLFTARRWPTLADRLRRPLKRLSIAVFALFLVAALAGNWQYFVTYVRRVVLAVFLHNATALAAGYWTAALLGLGERDRRAVSFEVGIQNSGLGLILIFAFFGGLGGMAIVAAWWGIWHVIAGMSLATWWSRRPVAPAAGESAG
ncbi:MAG: bile acid:sodium symporter family protein [Gemmatimonadetes bacterium]|nr:bile acid:sodium symporter family protein [Gemmatimonadota bacterium]